MVVMLAWAGTALFCPLARNSHAPLHSPNPPPHTHTHTSQADRAASRESLYEAYSLLHALAKDFKKPIEAPGDPHHPP